MTAAETPREGGRGLIAGTLDHALATCVVILARALTGVQAQWRGCAPEPVRRIYYANHVSHGDFVLLWTVLPPALRATTRPVAAADYWGRAGARRYIGTRLFNAVLIERNPAGADIHPVAMMAKALEAGDSLILFPEGTRNTTEEMLLPFKSGLYHLATACPGVECVPVWIDNLNRVMPKGEVLPIPLLCTVVFGTPVVLGEGEGKAEFIERARNALLALAPANRASADD